jgi:hypothetical protein
MPKQKKIIVDLPAPGEPLVPEVHQENKELIAEELQERLKLLQGKLKKRDLFFLNRRYKFLWRKLNDADFNELVKQRWAIKEQIERVKGLFDRAKGERRDGLRARGLELAAQGREVQAKIAALQPFADEFDEIGRRLRGHEIAVAYEKEDAENKAALDTEARTWEAQLYAAFRQNSRIHHKGTDSKGREFTITPIIEHIDISDDRVYYKIKLTSQNWIQRMFGKYSSALPYDVDIRDLTDPETLENLSGACNRAVTIDRGTRDQNLYYVVSRLDSPDGIPAKVLYSKVIQWYPVPDHPKTPWLAGQTKDRKVESLNFEDSPHILVAGSTLSGAKSGC